MELVGYVMALFIGLVMGLIGGGGSILAVPVLAYIFSLDEKVATAYSLFIVGSAALVGGFRQNHHNNVDWRTALVFGIPSLIGVWIVRHYVIPELPDVLFEIGSFEFSRRMAMFGLFSILMLCAAYYMLSSKERKNNNAVMVYDYPLIILEGLIVGAVTGFVGAGGGFLIIPALIAFANLDVKKAIGTSLIIIALKSLSGFLLGDALIMNIEWSFLIGFTMITLVGILTGIYLATYVNGQKLKKGFGYFLVVMAIFIFNMEFVFS